MEVGTYEAKTQLPKLLERVRRGERITITRHGKAIAELRPIDGGDRPQLREALARVDVTRRLAHERGRGRGVTTADILGAIREGRRQ